MTDYEPQVPASHYSERASYRSPARWSSYFHQLDWARSTGAATVLEIGTGSGVVARELAREGRQVTTLDIAEDLEPDVVGSVTAIPFPDDSFDLVVAAEVLEHIRFDDVSAALREIARVSRSAVVISLPHPGYVFSLSFRVPLLPTTALVTKIPFFWQRHEFDGEHYWELGKRGFPVTGFVAAAREAGLALERQQTYADDPGHRFFLFRA